MTRANLILSTMAVLSIGSLAAGVTAGADVRDPLDPYGVGGYGGIGHPVVGPVGPVGVGGVVGPVGVDPVARAAVDTVAVDDAIHYAIPPDYPLVAAYPGEVPCLTPDGMPYYTPGADPCLCFAPTGDVVPC